MSVKLLPHGVYPGAYLQFSFLVCFIVFQPRTIYAKAVANPHSIKTHNMKISNDKLNVFIGHCSQGTYWYNMNSFISWLLVITYKS